ncbi:MAG: NYN domain-containing protein [Armatimonadia bacterium]
MLSSSPLAPSRQNVVFFIDGMNLWHECERKFHHGNVHPDLLAAQFLGTRHLKQIRFYCGIDNPRERPTRHASRTRQHKSFEAKGVYVWTNTMKYSDREAVVEGVPPCQCGFRKSRMVRDAREKGIDLRIALDMLRMARHGEFDVAVLVSADNDMKQVVDELKRLADEIGRKIAVENVVVWDEGNKKYPRIPGCSRYHIVNDAVFQIIKDTDDYTRSPAATPSSVIP